MIWMLREDPGYFAETILDWRAHRQEMLFDTNGKTHPIFDPINEPIFWERVVYNLTFNSVFGAGYLGLYSRSGCQSSEAEKSPRSRHLSRENPSRAVCSSNLQTVPPSQTVRKRPHRTSPNRLPSLSTNAALLGPRAGTEPEQNRCPNQEQGLER